jgi:hypothetical protein
MDWTKEIPWEISLKKEDNIKLKLEEIEHEDVGWTDVGHNRIQCNDLVNTVINLPFP